MPPHSINHRATTIEWGQLTLSLVPGLQIVAQQERDQLYWHLRLPDSGRCFRIGSPEYALLSLFDGRTSLAAAVTQLARAGHGQDLTYAEAEAFCEWLLTSGIAVVQNQRASTSSSPTPEQPEHFNPLWIKIPLPVPQAFLSGLSVAARPLFAPITAAITFLIIMSGLVHFLGHSAEIIASCTRIIASGQWLGLLLIWLALKVVHELGHAAACQYFCSRALQKNAAATHQKVQPIIHEWGLVLIALVPTPFVDVSASWLLTSRIQRITIAAAGMLVELLIAAIAAWGWSHTNSPLFNQYLCNIMLLAGVNTLVFNANPLMRFDGYYILSDAVNIPNLSQRANSYWQSIVYRWCVEPTPIQATEVGWRTWFIASYGLAATCYQLAVTITLLLIISLFYEGAGLALTMALLLVALSKLLVALHQTWPTLSPAAVPRLLRSLFAGGTLATASVAAWLYFPVPWATTHTGIVELNQRTTVRAETAGFVKAIYVDLGDEVTAGQLLLQLQDDDLKAQFQQLSAQIERAKLIGRIHRQKKDFAKEQAVLEESQALFSQLRSLQDQQARLAIYAPHAGRIIIRNPDDKLGTYIQAGDELLHVATPADQEVLVAIPQRDLPALTSLEHRTVSIRPHGLLLPMQGQIESIDPHASLTPIHDALTAPHGGPIPVEAISDPQSQSPRLQTTTPYFRLNVTLANPQLANPPSSATPSLMPGQLVTVTLPTNHESLARYISRHWQSWHQSLSPTP